MSLFSKLKDYNLKLDEILDNKYFSSNIKNLLLSMVYKIEVSYPDFFEVKRCVRSKEEVINEIVETIRDYCDNIKTVEPDSDQAKMLIRHNLDALTNEKERSILTYPSEASLMYAVSDISPKYFFISKENALKELIQNCLVNGYNLNSVEILKSFSGWSWDLIEIGEENYIDNLIYQNLLVMLSEKFLADWRTYNSLDRDFIREIKKYIKIFTSDDNYLKALYKVLYLNSSGKERERVDEELKAKRQQLKKMEDKEKFLDDCKNRKMKLSKRIEKIDLLFVNQVMLSKELEKANAKLPEEKKIKSVRSYKNLLVKEKEKYMKEIQDISSLIKPSNFLRERDALREVLEVYNSKESLEDAVIELQLEFLHFIEKKLSKMKTRDEIIDIIYEIRYYTKLKVIGNRYTIDFEQIDEEIDKILKKAITSLCKLGAMKIISMDIDLNCEIIRYALNTKIIKLEDIKICLVPDEQGLIIKVFDKDVFEKQGRKKLEGNEITLETRPNRKIKIFN